MLRVPCCHAVSRQGARGVFKAQPTYQFRNVKRYLSQNASMKCHYCRYGSKKRVAEIGLVRVHVSRCGAERKSFQVATKGQTYLFTFVLQWGCWLFTLTASYLILYVHCNNVFNVCVSLPSRLHIRRHCFKERNNSSKKS